MKCTKDCPTGFTCVNPDPSGPNGRCYPIKDSGPITDLPAFVSRDGATQSGIDAVLPDGVHLDVAWLDSDQNEVDTLGALDTPPIDGPPDQPLATETGLGSDARPTGGQGGIAGSGGASGIGGVSGSGGVAGRDGGGSTADVGMDLAASGGTLGSGGDTRPTDASISSGGAPGTGGTGTGGATGTGGNGTGGLSGTGGTIGTGGVTGTGGGGGSTSTGGVTVQLNQTHQTIEGFGISTALSSATPPWDTLFSTTGNGLGLSIVRVAMSSTGALSGAVPAASYNAKIIGSAWTAPANCKDNNNTSKGGHLLTSCYDSWSTTITNFAKSQGLYAMSAANEPDFASCGSSIGPPCNGDYDTMVYTANEMVAFVKVLGPKLEAAGIKLIAPETQEWIHLWSNTSATGSTVASHPNSSDPLKCGCFGTSTSCATTCTQGNGYDYGHWLASDATAWAAIDIIGTHEYDTQHAESWPSDVDGGKRSKEVWDTEMSGLMYWPEQGPSSDINNGIAVAGWIHSALVVGEASAWLYWWYQQSGSNDNEGLLLSGSTALTKRYFTLGNYSRFVRPGYVMVDVLGNSNPNLLLSAFTGTNGTVVVVAINKSAAPVDVPTTISGGTTPASCTPYVTSSSANLTAGSPITVTDGTFTASLAATTVTTFVCM
jgi:glucuronoarabinoxylan endo-1,4-beta-xylanase